MTEPAPQAPSEPEAGPAGTTADTADTYTDTDTEAVGRFARVVRAPFLAMIVVYQRVVSPWTSSSCRYYPSCSAYAYQAIAAHGVLRGTWLGLRRLGRCHPWAAGGVDPVPPPHHHPAVPTASRGA